MTGVGGGLGDTPGEGWGYGGDDVFPKWSPDLRSVCWGEWESREYLCTVRTEERLTLLHDGVGGHGGVARTRSQVGWDPSTPVLRPPSRAPLAGGRGTHPGDRTRITDG